MTDPAKKNPENPLLEPAEKSYEDYLMPAAIGVGALALAYGFTRSKKSGKASSVDAGRDEVGFSANFSSYSIGKDWQEVILEPYLAEQAEEGNLLLNGESHADNVTASRKDVLIAFRGTHKVGTKGGDKLISDLPDKNGVRKFNIWLDQVAAEFQENY